MDTPAKQAVRVARFMKLLPAGEDKVLIILKGHLLIEELLSEVLNQYLELKNPLNIKVTNNMMFAKKLELCWALSDFNGISNNFWSALKTLNSLRNKFSHNIEPKGVDDNIAKFIQEIERFDPFGYIHNFNNHKLELAISCLYIMLNEQLGNLRNT